MKRTIECKASVITKVREAGAKVTKLWLNSSTHEGYEGRKRHKSDYLYGFKAECDNVDLIHFVR